MAIQNQVFERKEITNQLQEGLYHGLDPFELWIQLDLLFILVLAAFGLSLFALLVRFFS